METVEELQTFNIILINIVCYMMGIFSGFAFCIKYKPKNENNENQHVLTTYPNQQFISPLRTTSEAHNIPPPLTLDSCVIAESPQTEIVIRK